MVCVRRKERKESEVTALSGQCLVFKSVAREQRSLAWTALCELTMQAC